jgi:C-terminal processing protease CtpA/Prc
MYQEDSFPQDKDKSTTAEEEKKDDLNESMFCMRDSELTWLERYWINQKKVKLKKQDNSSVDLLTRLQEKSGSQLRIRKPVEMGVISIPALTKEESVDKDQYSVSFSLPRLQSSTSSRSLSLSGLGIEWKITATCRVYVNGFSILEGYRIGPAEACCLIQRNDELLAVNNVKISSFSDNIHRLTDLIKSIDNLAKVSQNILFFLVFILYSFVLK